MAEHNDGISQEQFVAFLEAIKSGSLQETENILRASGPAIANKLESQLKQPALYFAALTQGDDVSSELFKLLIRHGANYKFKDQNGQTILFYVCREGKQKCAEILLSQGLSLDDVDVYGQTAMFYAVSENKIEIVRNYATKQRVNHADNLAGQTPLYYAARRGHLQLCRILIEKGADITHMDSNGKNAIQFARKAKYTEVVELLNNQLKRTKEEGNKISMQSYSIQQSNQRKKKQDSHKSQRQTYKMVFLDEKGQPHDLTEQQVRQLVKQRPELQAYLTNPQQIPQQLVNNSNGENWLKAAGKIIAHCLKIKGSYWFSEPVDPVKYNILDYFDIVSTPMDLNTIRKKISHNCYTNPNQFMDDMSLIWQNCYKYNGESHEISRCAKQLQTGFRQFTNTYGFDKFLQNK